MTQPSRLRFSAAHRAKRKEREANRRVREVVVIPGENWRGSAKVDLARVGIMVLAEEATNYGVDMKLLIVRKASQPLPDWLLMGRRGQVIGY